MWLFVYWLLVASQTSAPSEWAVSRFGEGERGCSRGGGLFFGLFGFTGARDTLSD